MAIEFIKEVSYHKRHVRIEVLFFIEARHVKKMMLDTAFYEIIKSAFNGSGINHQRLYTELTYTYNITYDNLDSFFELDTDDVYYELISDNEQIHDKDDDRIRFIHTLFDYVKYQKLFPLHGVQNDWY